MLKPFVNAFLAWRKTTGDSKIRDFCLEFCPEKKNRAWNPGSDLCPHLLAFKVAPREKDNSGGTSPLCPEIQYLQAVSNRPSPARAEGSAQAALCRPHNVN